MPYGARTSSEAHHSHLVWSSLFVSCREFAACSGSHLLVELACWTCKSFMRRCKHSDYLSWLDKQLHLWPITPPLMWNICALPVLACRWEAGVLKKSRRRTASTWGSSIWMNFQSDSTSVGCRSKSSYDHLTHPQVRQFERRTGPEVSFRKHLRKLNVKGITIRYTPNAIHRSAAPQKVNDHTSLPNSTVHRQVMRSADA